MSQPRDRTSSFLPDGTPVDKHDKCYYILVLVGTGLLLPWNAVLTAFDYFSDTYGSWTNLSVPLLNQAANLVFMLLMVKYGANFSFTRRIVTTLMIYVICLIAIPCLSFLATDFKTIALVLTFVIFIILGATCAILQASLFGLCGSLPPVYTNAIMAGSAISGVLMNVLMMATKGLLQKFYTGHSDESSNKIEAFVFFGFSALVEVVCIFGYLYVVRKPFMQHHVAHLFSVLEDGDEEPLEAITSGEGGDISGVKEPRASSNSPEYTDDVAEEATQTQESPEVKAKWRSASVDEFPTEEEDSRTKPVAVVRGHRSYSQGQLMSEEFGDRETMAKIERWKTGEALHESPKQYSLRDLMEPARRRAATSTTPTSSFKQQSYEQGTPSGCEDLEEPFIGTGEGKALSTTDNQDLDIEPDLKAVVKKVQGYGVAVISVFFISLYIFPGFLTVLCAKGFWGTGSTADDWMRLTLLTAFNVMDLIGRLIAPGVGKSLFQGGTLSKINFVSALRLGFVPIAWLCVLKNIDTVYLPLIMTLLLGFTNGCLGSLCMMYAPQQCSVHEQELAGTVMSLCLMLGITSGALAQDAMTPVFNAQDFGNCHD